MTNIEFSICYFSGTGNARWVASQVKQECGFNGKYSRLYDISNLRQDDLSEISEATDIMLVFPTHGFNAPAIVYQFLSQIRLQRKNVYLFNTRAGLLIHKWNSPGLSGIALWWPAFLLILRGNVIRGFCPVDLPSNWISLHPALSLNACNKIREIWLNRLKGISQQIVKGKSIKKGFLFLPIDICLIPISCVYYSIGRFALAKTFFASIECHGCAQCADNCPVSAIIMKRDKPYWTLKCESCMKCMNKCPENAIQTAHLWFFTTCIVFLFLSGVATDSLLRFSGVETNAVKYFIEIVIFCILTIPVVSISYEILQLALRSRELRWFITVTSLTHLKIWGRFKGLK